MSSISLESFSLFVDCVHSCAKMALLLRSIVRTFIFTDANRADRRWKVLMEICSLTMTRLHRGPRGASVPEVRWSAAARRGRKRRRSRFILEPRT